MLIQDKHAVEQRLLIQSAICGHWWHDDGGL